MHLKKKQGWRHFSQAMTTLWLMRKSRYLRDVANVGEDAAQYDRGYTDDLVLYADLAGLKVLPSTPRYLIPHVRNASLATLVPRRSQARLIRPRVVAHPNRPVPRPSRQSS